MLYILMHEFKLLFFKIKTVILAIILFGFVFGFGTALALLNVNEISYYLSLSFIFAIFGLIIISIQSNHIISAEEENTTIRLLITKATRLDIVLGKFLGIFLYWVVIVTIQYLLIFFKTGTIYFELYYSLISFIFFGCAFNIFISSISKTIIQSNFISLIVSILLTSIFINKWLSIETNFDWSIFFLPQTYLVEYYNFAILSIFVGLIFILVSYLIIRKRDY